MGSIVTLTLLHPGAEGALLEDDAFLKGTGLPQGAIHISLPKVNGLIMGTLQVRWCDF